MRVPGRAEQEHHAVARARTLELLPRVLRSDAAADHSRRRPRSDDLLPHLAVAVESTRREGTDLDVVGAEQPRQLREDTCGDRHRAPRRRNAAPTRCTKIGSPCSRSRAIEPSPARKALIISARAPASTIASASAPVTFAA